MQKTFGHIQAGLGTLGATIKLLITHNPIASVYLRWGGLMKRIVKDQFKVS